MILELMTLDISSLSIEPQEQNALASFVAHLTSSESKEKTLSDLVAGDGEWEGFSCKLVLCFKLFDLNL